MKHIYFLTVIVLVLFSACGRKEHYDPYADRDGKNKTVTAEKTKGFDIPYEEENGVKMLHVVLNNSAGARAIFDTGCSGVSISLAEVLSMVKQNALSENDIAGQSITKNANGQYNVNDVVELQLSISDTKGEQHTVRVSATIQDNFEADILIGNTVIDQLAKRFYRVDLDNRTIHFE